MASKTRKSCGAFLLYLLLMALPREAWTGLLTFPGPAPCDTTLQACITGATAEDVIEIATNNRIDETLSIAKSLTLMPAAGFTPLIGNPDPTNPNFINVTDAGPGGGSVSIIFQGLNLDAVQLDVDFSDESGHRFEMTECRLSHNLDHNNETGVSLDSVRVPSTILLLNNFIASPGQPIGHGTGGTGIGNVEITLQGNFITTTDPSNSHQGIQVRIAGDENLTMNLVNNVIFGVGGCNCGGPAGIEVITSESATAVLNILNNTLDDVATGRGLEISANGSSSLTVNFFNNSVSNAQDEGVLATPGAGLTINNGFNNFFNNGQPNAGFTEGAGTLFVDPLFVDPAGENYRLQPGSLLINAGTNSPGVTLPAVDVENFPRIVGGTVDIGAHEAGTDLELIKTASSAFLNAGETLTYTLTVTNRGPYDTTGVVLTDTLPAGLTVQTVTPSQGSCGLGSPLVCDLGDLANGASATVTLEVTPQQAGTVTNTATVTSQVPDTDPANDSASVNTTVSSASPALPDIAGGGCSMGGGGASEISWIFLLLSPLFSFFYRKKK